MSSSIKITASVVALIEATAKAKNDAQRKDLEELFPGVDLLERDKFKRTNDEHDIVNLKDIKCLWDEERYLKPFIQDDSLLYSFEECEEIEHDQFTPINEEELVGDLKNSEEICGGDQNTVKKMVLVME
ncbi:hypothetical protein K1719_013511 [Acacia pycnantha]|nr:hypothetical protein K1719_013511 [Acacia pycnantha]